MRKTPLKRAPRSLVNLLSDVKGGARAVILETGAPQPPPQDDPDARAVIIATG